MQGPEDIAAAKCAVKQMNKARKFMINTDPCSRHAALIAEALAKKGAYPMLQSEPRYCAEAIALTVASLWELRSFMQAEGYVWKDGKWMRADV